MLKSKENGPKKNGPLEVNTISVARPNRLVCVETWVTGSAPSDDGWGDVKPFLFVRLTTSDGTIGWGEAFVLPCREKAVAEIIQALGQVIMAGDVITPWTFRELAYRIADKHRGLDYMAATSAIEIALWDITAKQAELPLYEILGASGNQQVSVYANCWSKPNPTITHFVDRTHALLVQGFRSMKIHTSQFSTVKEASDCVAQLYATFGDEIDLMLDLGAPKNIEQSLELASAIAPFKPYWFEEPADGEDIQALIEIRKKTGLRVMTGEKQCGVPHFKTILAVGAADILNPDIAGVGGILDMLEISALAHAKGVAISPHCWDSMTVAAAAMLHVCASIPNAEKAEIYPEYISNCERIGTIGFTLKNGQAILSDQPGLGVEMNVEVLAVVATDYRISSLPNRH
jgi:galactonate dehydratase